MSVNLGEEDEGEEGLQEEGGGGEKAGGAKEVSEAGEAQAIPGKNLTPNINMPFAVPCACRALANFCCKC